MAKRKPVQRTPHAIYRELAGGRVEMDTGIIKDVFYKGPAAGGPFPDRSGEGFRFPRPASTWQKEVHRLVNDAIEAATGGLEKGFSVEFLFDLIHPTNGPGWPDLVSHDAGEFGENLHKMWVAAYHVGRIVERLRHVRPFERIVMQKRHTWGSRDRKNASRRMTAKERKETAIKIANEVASSSENKEDVIRRVVARTGFKIGTVRGRYLAKWRFPKKKKRAQ